jgi:NAD+ synthase (glutamine-hydrolysing)
MQINLHQTSNSIGDFASIITYLEKSFESDSTQGVHVFPELFLTGYPLQDLCLQKSFIDRYLQFLKTINEWSIHNLKSNSELLLLLGGLDYEFDENGLPLKIKNVIYALQPGSELKVVYTKKLLPNYDIFDEEKYYSPGNESCILPFNDKNLGLLICEDMWVSSHHNIDPVEDLKVFAQEQNTKLDTIINLSASPYNLGKEQKRLKRASEISNDLEAPFVYVNMASGEDEILFDGASFIVNGDKVILKGNIFTDDFYSLDVPAYELTKKKKTKKIIENTWESLFEPNLIIPKTGLPTIPTLSDEDCAEILQALKFGIQQYAKKTGFKKFDVALSGGIDSALVVAIMRLILEEDQDLEAIYMPGFFSAGLSYDLSAQLCKNLGIKMYTLPIKFFHSAIRNSFGETFGVKMEGLADENIQSRLRGSLLYARSNQRGSMVLNTSNKSEIAVGYSTLYGDSVGAISVLGDLYKSEVFRLSEYINKKYNNLIPEEIITRPPSAELREDQEDSQSLPPYDRLDAILEGILSYRYSPHDLISQGFDQKEIEKVYGLYQKSEYKRNQFCPIIKLKSKSFGFGYRVPICKKIRY